jgi:hypothetical protein
MSTPFGKSFRILFRHPKTNTRSTHPPHQPDPTNRPNQPTRPTDPTRPNQPTRPDPTRPDPTRARRERPAPTHRPTHRSTDRTLPDPDPPPNAPQQLPHLGTVSPRSRSQKLAAAAKKNSKNSNISDISPKKVATRCYLRYYVPMFHNYYIGLRLAIDRIGLDPWDIDAHYTMRFVRSNECEPTSRYWFGSPCRFVRSIDMAVHVWLPEMVAERHPVWACYLRSTSPRWGRTWREW